MRNGIKEVFIFMRFLYKSISTLNETYDSDGSDFYGFCEDFEEYKGRWHIEIDGGGDVNVEKSS